MKADQGARQLSAMTTHCTGLNTPPRVLLGGRANVDTDGRFKCVTGTSPEFHNFTAGHMPKALQG